MAQQPLKIGSSDQWLINQSGFGFFSPVASSTMLAGDHDKGQKQDGHSQSPTNHSAART